MQPLLPRAQDAGRRRAGSNRQRKKRTSKGRSVRTSRSTVDRKRKKKNEKKKPRQRPIDPHGGKKTTPRPVQARPQDQSRGAAASHEAARRWVRPRRVEKAKEGKRLGEAMGRIRKHVDGVLRFPGRKTRIDGSKWRTQRQRHEQTHRRAENAAEEPERGHRFISKVELGRIGMSKGCRVERGFPNPLLPCYVGRVSVATFFLSFIHFFATHFSPCNTGHPAWSACMSTVASGLAVKRRSPSPFLGFTVNPCLQLL